MADRITWASTSGTSLWVGKVGTKSWFYLSRDPSTGVYKLSEAGLNSPDFATSSDVAELKAKAEKMIQDIVDQGLPIE